MLPGFAERQKALEDAFFKDQEKKQLAALRAEQDKREAKELMREASGIADDAVLDKLIELELHAESVCAMTMVPLVRVAWADGSVQDKEREAILKAADNKGIASGSPAFELLESWLTHQPGPDLASAWTDYIGALSAQLTDGQRSALSGMIAQRARAVAEAAGGFLGMKTVSASEEAVLADITKAFG